MRVLKGVWALWVLLAGLFLLPSCATLFHQKTVDVHVYSDVDTATVLVRGLEGKWQTPATIALERSREEVVIQVRNDSLQKELVLRSRLSGNFWIGNLFWYAPIGHIIDLTNPKRFTYPKENYVALLTEKYTGPPQKVRQYLHPSVKNQLNLKFGFPEGNLFYLRKQNGYGNSAGFLGFSTGFEYFLSDRNSINVDIGTMTDFIIPVPAPYDVEGPYNRTFASYLDVQAGRDFGRFHADVGLQGNRTTYVERETLELFPDYIDTLRYYVRQYQAGLALSGYYKIVDHFNLGLNYYPSVFTWHQGKFDFHYAHLIMFELIFRFKLNGKALARQQKQYN